MERKDGRVLLIQTFTLQMPSNAVIKQSISRNNGHLQLTGRIQWADHLNGNDRYYPRRILEKQVDRYKQKIRMNMAFGQCDHPQSDIVSLKNIAFLMKQIHWEGDQVIGTIRLSSTRIGRDMQALVVQDGATLSISSRGIGSLKRTKIGDEVQDDYQIISWDLVVQPSTPGASFWNGVRQSITVDSKLQKIIQNKTLKKMGKTAKINYLVSQINNLIKGR